jgi:phage portal protein BeeE
MDRYRAQGYYEGMASGASVLMTYGADANREIAAQNLVTQAQQAYATNGVVFAIILVRQMLLSEATFKLRNKVTKELYGRPDLRILEEPWPNGTAGDLWARMEQDVSLAGNAFIAKVEDDTLLRLPPSEVTIVSRVETSLGGTRYRQVIGYDWDPDKVNARPGQPSRTAQFFTVDEVAHWSPYPDPAANFRGMSWLTPVLREVAADTGMTQYKTQYMDHGSPVVAVKYPMKLRPDTIDSVVDRIMAKYGGLGNAFKPLVFDQGADPTLGSTLNELNFAAVQAAGEARVCAAGGVDPMLLGLRGDRTPAASEQDVMHRFEVITARPLWRSGCAALQKLVPNIPAQGVQLWFDTSDIAALQSAETERAQVAQVSAAALLTLVQAGFTRESAKLALTTGDPGVLKEDPRAPAPGTTGQGGAPETVNPPGGKTGVPPGGPGVLTAPQTPATKIPMPSSIPTPAGAGRPVANPPSANGRH